MGGIDKMTIVYKPKKYSYRKNPYKSFNERVAYRSGFYEGKDARSKELKRKGRQIELR